MPKKVNSIRWDNINRRRFIRVDYPFTIHIHTFEGPTYSAYTENVSAGGVMVTLMEELKEGAIVDLEIYTSLKTIGCKGKIIRIKKRESKYLECMLFYDTGIEFQDISEKDRGLIKSLVADIMEGEEEG